MPHNISKANSTITHHLKAAVEAPPQHLKTHPCTCQPQHSTVRHCVQHLPPYRGSLLLKLAPKQQHSNDAAAASHTPAGAAPPPSSCCCCCFRLALLLAAPQLRTSRLPTAMPPGLTAPAAPQWCISPPSYRPLASLLSARQAHQVPVCSTGHDSKTTPTQGTCVCCLFVTNTMPNICVCCHSRLPATFPMLPTLNTSTLLQGLAAHPCIVLLPALRSTWQHQHGVLHHHHRPLHLCCKHTCPQSASTWQKTYLFRSGFSSSFLSLSASYRFT